jgi:hypothetical protein
MFVFSGSRDGCCEKSAFRVVGKLAQKLSIVAKKSIHHEKHDYASNVDALRDVTFATT